MLLHKTQQYFQYKTSEFWLIFRNRIAEIMVFDNANQLDSIQNKISQYERIEHNFYQSFDDSYYLS